MRPKLVNVHMIHLFAKSWENFPLNPVLIILPAMRVQEDYELPLFMEWLEWQL